VGNGTCRFNDLETLEQSLVEFLDRFFPLVKVRYEGEVYNTVELACEAVRGVW